MDRKDSVAKARRCHVTAGVPWWGGSAGTAGLGGTTDLADTAGRPGSRDRMAWLAGWQTMFYSAVNTAGSAGMARLAWLASWLAMLKSSVSWCIDGQGGWQTHSGSMRILPCGLRSPFASSFLLQIGVDSDL